MLYEDIKNSKYFVKTYNKIEKIKKDFYVNHGFVHVNNVFNNGERLAKTFGLTELEKERLLVACLLHDVGYLKGRDNHACNGSVMVREYLKKRGVCGECIDVICSAVANHGGKKESDFFNKVSFCLIAADKLDFVCNRYDSLLLKDESKRRIFLNVLDTYIDYCGKLLVLNIVVKKDFQTDLFENSKYFVKLDVFLGYLSKRLGCEYRVDYIFKYIFLL